LATFPAALPGIPYGGFSPVRLQAPGTTTFGAEPSHVRSRVKSGPDVPRHEVVGSTLRDHLSQKVLPPQRAGPWPTMIPPGPRGPRSGWFMLASPQRLLASSASLVLSGPFPSRAGYKAGLWHSRTVLPEFQTFRAFTVKLYKIAAFNFRRESGACMPPFLPHRRWPSIRGKKILALQHPA
jgi:hypothetical protein